MTEAEWVERIASQLSTLACLEQAGLTGIPSVQFPG